MAGTVVEDGLNFVEAFFQAIFLMGAGLNDRDASEAFQQVAGAAEGRAIELKRMREKAWQLTRSGTPAP
jgi:hypothetical protein